MEIRAIGTYGTLIIEFDRWAEDVVQIDRRTANTLWCRLNRDGSARFDGWELHDRGELCGWECM
jgi:hypothetical protein